MFCKSHSLSSVEGKIGENGLSGSNNMNHGEMKNGDMKNGDMF